MASQKQLKNMQIIFPIFLKTLRENTFVGSENSSFEVSNIMNCCLLMRQNSKVNDVASVVAKVGYREKGAWRS